MKIKLIVLTLVSVAFIGLSSLYSKEESKMTIYDIKVTTIDEKEITLDKYRGKVMLIVNVASNCGFTSQYEGLQKLHEKYSSQGLAILGFPCNQFMNQEPQNNEKIKFFCTTTYNVGFDMFSKIEVNGKETHPLYAHLKKEASGVIGDSIKWNFTKFLVDREGKVIKRYAPSTTPQQIESDIAKIL